jgi:hypothetical protein
MTILEALTYAAGLIVTGLGVYLIRLAPTGFNLHSTIYVIGGLLLIRIGTMATIQGRDFWS